MPYLPRSERSAPDRTTSIMTAGEPQLMMPTLQKGHDPICKSPGMIPVDLPIGQKFMTSPTPKF